MAKYKVRLSVDAEHLKRLKDKGLYPFPKSGYEFFEDTVIETDDLSLFNESKMSKVLDPRLTAELIEEHHEASEATD